MRVFILLLGRWILGVAVYWVVGSILDGHLMGSGDLSAAALYSFVTPEALLFYVIFGTAGIVVGVGATRS